MQEATGLTYVLGGSARAGKSTCASKLAHEFGMVVVSGDSVRAGLQAASTDSDPINFFRSGCGWLEGDPKDSQRHKDEVARLTCERGLDPLIREGHPDRRNRLVEGDDLLPDWIAGWADAGLVTGGVLLVESDLDVVWSRYLQNDRTGCINGDHDRLDRFLAHYAAWVDSIKSQAIGHNVAVVDALGGDAYSRVKSSLGLE